MIEIIAMSPEEARCIESCGADRIELVSALSEGGLTPSYSIIKNVIRAVKIPVNVMIRPHVKSFTYTGEEIDMMKEDIILAKDLGANGVVFGVLNKNKEICENSLQDLLEVCQGLDVTFHKAIDELLSPDGGMNILTKYTGIKTVLTSGGKGKILENLSVLKKMTACSGHINVMVGGGLNFENIVQIIEETGAREYHFGTAVRDNKSISGSINEESIKKLIKVLKNPHDI